MVVVDDLSGGGGAGFSFDLDDEDLERLTEVSGVVLPKMQHTGGGGGVGGGGLNVEDHKGLWL